MSTWDLRSLRIDAQYSKTLPSTPIWESALMVRYDSFSRCQGVAVEKPAWADVFHFFALLGI